MSETNPYADALQEVFEMAHKLLAAIQFDDSGFEGKGGNGGLISRDTIRIADELRQALYRFNHR